MQDFHLLLDGLVGPSTVQVEVLDSHEAAHATIQLLILHFLQRVGLEVRVMEGGDLDLGKEDNEDVGVREARLRSVFL